MRFRTYFLVVANLHVIQPSHYFVRCFLLLGIGSGKLDLQLDRFHAGCVKARLLIFTAIIVG